jgi:hypothetical protein
MGVLTKPEKLFLRQVDEDRDMKHSSSRSPRGPVKIAFDNIFITSQ